MIHANQYRAFTQAVSEAIDLSVRGDGEPVTVEASGSVYDAVRDALYSECESVDDGFYSGADIDDRPWSVQLVTRDTVTRIEYMPVQLRDSHVTAGNSGVYPQNGAERIYVAGDVDPSVLDPVWASIIDSKVLRRPSHHVLPALPDDALAPVQAEP